MYKHLRTLLATLALTGLSFAAQGALIEVSQGGISLGYINSFSDGTGNTTAQNYNYYSNRNHLITGPTLYNQQGHVFFYQGSDGLSFNAIFGSVGDGPNASVSWDLALAGNVGNANVLVGDDNNEFTEPSANNFRGRWNYIQSLGDGGAIGALSGDNWVLTVDPLSYTNVLALNAYDANGNNIALSLDTSQNIVFSAATSVPEPGTLALIGFGLVGLGIGKKKRRATV